MEHRVCWLEAVPGHPALRDQRRGLAFLVYPKDKRVSAKGSFCELTDQVKRKFHHAMDCWLGGIDNRPAHHHGWDKNQFSGKFVNLWVFKCHDSQTGHRLYGFMQNPDPKRPRLRLCILVEYASKDQDETDEAILRRVESIRTLQVVTKAAQDYVIRLE